MRIAIVGSPGSGKTTLASMLYSRCLLGGLSKARLVLEEAPRYIGENGHLDTLADQIQCWHLQELDCIRNEAGGFNPVILDGALWLSSVYVRYSTTEAVFPNYFAGLTFNDAAEHISESEQYLTKYDLTLYTPWVDRRVETGLHRIHDGDQSRTIDQYIQKSLARIDSQMMVCPAPFGLRPQFLSEVYERIKAWT